MKLGCTEPILAILSVEPAIPRSPSWTSWQKHWVSRSVLYWTDRGLTHVAINRRKTLVDLREFPRALELSRSLYREKKHLSQSLECVEIAELLGVSNIAVWHAYHRGDLGVPSPNPARAEAWARGEAYYIAPDRKCRKCHGERRIPGDDTCYDCARGRRDKMRRS